ncbi:MAG: hypothetical protein A2268_14610 [Candidatus Raymondbacteria bacterium RifOxyA12_full_50_37]|uniref:Transporter n=1 Tax=Candidatus Raymondbacteria bacterium RIFOXYD12_FULL_49_13 TaxID=1817890 RepID=A0A1F7F2N0_UNCRA|nr:MAG: hypothetical protein A2268_14610 [Candidatus Raymondbacteria bacterium RifOxyA12_full_50_37]OGJ87796.1 MAG: hypothetical protein A2350_12550 [Candidatus Raymondbacteria bacterium RifOxyB12_full_50_8]OGJ88651.1 MAG: hypothetical protein A2248_20545 [Candidatus Raymondbacteria bacterium RIFOXYA2_FULL_49_16]OGK00823.1 MAG: hypothetical protein A2519_07800 [Candidatus Raymondbacteria bacterium RIFOXYD12_FULL_49_13]OGK02874.1 MAG: hypothetical protein A2487_17765 [Candidatus Raymondbacteria 
MDSTFTLKKTALLPLLLLFILPGHPSAQETLTINKAIAHVLEQNGGIQAALKEQAATRHGLRQAARLPNPELEVETENLGDATTSLKLSQPVELGGKRKARVRMARADSLKAFAELETRRAAIIAETHRRFYKALSHQKQIEQLDSLILFAESIKTNIEKQVEIGRSGKTELLRSMKDITLLRIEQNTLVREYENSIIALGALWGAGKNSIQGVSGELQTSRRSAIRDSLETYVEQSPLLHAALAEIEAAIAQENASRAQGVPEFSIKGGYARDAGAGDNLYSLGATVGLPLFNRNKDAVAAAINRTGAAGKKADELRNELYARLMQSLGQIDQLEFKATELKERVIPQTGEVLVELRRLFEAGKSGYVELITTQRELVDAWRDYLTTETEIRLALADIIELTGQQ